MMKKCCVGWSLCFLVGILGCDNRDLGKFGNEPPKKTRWQKGSAEAAAVLAKGGTPSDGKKRKAVPLEHAKLSASAWRPSESSGEGGYGSRGTAFSSRSESQAMQQITKIIKQSLEVGPTLVVWVVDRSESANRLVNSALTAGKTIYGEEAIAAAAKEDKLLSAVVCFSEAAEFVLDPPAGDPEKVLSALEAIKSVPGSREAIFTALSSALEKYAPLRRQANREVLFVVLTDEPGDDLQNLETVISSVKKNVIPVYVVGSTVPVGRLDDPGNANPGAAKPKVAADTLTLAIDALHSDLPALDFPSNRFGSTQAYDSGFGPWALERLCRESSGMYLGVGSSQGAGSMLSRVDPAIMNKYAPDYLSAEACNQLIMENKCREALTKVALMPRAETLTNPQLTFPKANNEANNVKMLNNAQREPARIEQAINKIYDTLVAAEGDRAKLTGQRWQAAYDTAYGRACAIKVRVDGYNAMVAALKRGKTFANKDSNTWIIEPSDTIETGSASQKLAEKAKLYLERVQTEHPGTPWAEMAKNELETPLGWVFSEQ
jgi:hypothetical protein